MAKIISQLPVSCYYISGYGNNHDLTYYDSIDRRAFLQRLDALCKQQQWRCHAWCLMCDHYRLLIEAPGEPELLAAGIQQLNHAYRVFFNHRHKRAQASFSHHTQRQVPANELTLAARHIVLTPVRAHRAGAAIEWPWSSYRSLIGCPKQLQSLDTDMLLGCFYQHRHLAVRAWKAFVAAGIKSPTRPEKAWELAPFESRQESSPPPNTTSTPTKQPLKRR